MPGTTGFAIQSKNNKGSKLGPAITELELSPTFADEELDLFSRSGALSPTSPISTPFIKDELADEQFFSMNNGADSFQDQTFNMSPPPQGQSDSIDPSDLSMQNGNFFPSFTNFGGSQQNTNSFTQGAAGIADDELLDLGNLDDSGGMSNGFQGDQAFSLPSQLEQQQARQGFGNTQHSQPVFSERGPVQSPFVNPFNYDQLQQSQQQSQSQQSQQPSQQQFAQAIGNSSPFSQSAAQRMSGSHSGSFEAGAGAFMPDHSQHQQQQQQHPRPRMVGLERQGSSSHSRSPLTPKTPGMGMGGGMNLGTPDSGSFPTQPIRTGSSAAAAQKRHQKSLSNQWESASGSMPSYMDSPISSPGGQPSHPAAHINEMFRSGKHASLPAKVDSHPHGHGPGHGTAAAFQSSEAKKRRRRESHNMVERRRRDNINERIQELSHLVPAHRLEDEKVRKLLLNNTPLSPGGNSALGSGMSPPQATSLLAGGAGKRAASTGGVVGSAPVAVPGGPGLVTTGIPADEKDKGPNKGDILNGSVSWTRDLMWALYAKIQQESEVAEYVAQLGGTWPFELTEDDKRMRTELLDAMENNDGGSFAYSRGPGSGLRVPKHTSLAGDPLAQTMLSPQSSPNGTWPTAASSSTNDPVAFKEEDEYGMDME